MTGRRSFLKALLATAVVDPERLLWVPGVKTISIPKPKSYTMLDLYMIEIVQRSNQLYRKYTIPRTDMILHPRQIEAYNRLRSWNRGY